MDNIQVEMDSQKVYQAISSNNKVSAFNLIINDIKEIAK